MLRPNLSFAGVMTAPLAIIGGMLLFIFPAFAVLLSLLCGLVLAWPRRTKTVSRLQLP